MSKETLITIDTIGMAICGVITAYYQYRSQIYVADETNQQLFAAGVFGVTIFAMQLFFLITTYEKKTNNIAPLKTIIHTDTNDYYDRINNVNNKHTAHNDNTDHKDRNENK